MSDSNCIFCRIAAGQIPSTKVYEDDDAFAFRDINAQAPTHVLLIPKKHIASLNEASSEDQRLLGHLMSLAPQIAKQEGISDSGFRVVVNTGTEAGQSVWHIHLHVMGGRAMHWPPG
jgi:histidine triad (HIT) family protein